MNHAAEFLFTDVDLSKLAFKSACKCYENCYFDIFEINWFDEAVTTDVKS